MKNYKMPQNSAVIITHDKGHQWRSILERVTAPSAYDPAARQCCGLLLLYYFFLDCIFTSEEQISHSFNSLATPNRFSLLIIPLFSGVVNHSLLPDYCSCWYATIFLSIFFSQAHCDKVPLAPPRAFFLCVLLLVLKKKKCQIKYEQWCKFQFSNWKS